MVTAARAKQIMLLMLTGICTSFVGGAQAAQEPQYRYGYFKYTSFTLADPSRGYCGPHCREPNPQTSSTIIHSAIFELPDPRKVDLFVTGREFCNQARRHFSEAWWRQSGFGDCVGSWPNTYTTAERAIEDLERDYKNNGPQSGLKNALIFQFDQYRPQNFTLVVLRFPGAIPAPSVQGGARSTQSTEDTSPTRLVPAPAPASTLRTAIPAEQPVSVPVTSAQELAEIATRERLNREQAAFAQKQLAENAAAKAAFEKATAERDAIIAAQQAEAERKQREYEAAMARWRADVEACQKGDLSRCAQ